MPHNLGVPVAPPNAIINPKKARYGIFKKDLLNVVKSPLKPSSGVRARVRVRAHSRVCVCPSTHLDDLCECVRRGLGQQGQGEAAVQLPDRGGQ